MTQLLLTGLKFHPSEPAAGLLQLVLSHAQLLTITKHHNQAQLGYQELCFMCVSLLTMCPACPPLRS